MIERHVIDRWMSMLYLSIGALVVLWGAATYVGIFPNPHAHDAAFKIGAVGLVLIGVGAARFFKARARAKAFRAGAAA
jgi:hypothetical protein